jgi:hypothetical protein
MYITLALLVDALEKQQGLKRQRRDDGSLEPLPRPSKGHIGQIYRFLQEEVVVDRLYRGKVQSVDRPQQNNLMSLFFVRISSRSQNIHGRKGSQL